jgi:hypothetical protein
MIAFFGADGITIYYCRYRHETAYAAAFGRLFSTTGPSRRRPGGDPTAHGR